MHSYPLRSDHVSPINSLAPAPPLRLQSGFGGKLDVLLRELKARLPACGAWISHCEPPRSEAVTCHFADLRFELLVSGSWDLYALLVGCGLELSAASHRRLHELSNVCRHPDRRSAGSVVDIDLRIVRGQAPCVAAADHTAGCGPGRA